MGMASFVATAYILTILPDFMVRLCLWFLTHTFYRIDVRGIENLPEAAGRCSCAATFPSLTLF